MPRSLTTFLLLSAINNLGLGLYVVVIAWTAFQVSDDVAVIGHIFLIGSLANLVTAPFIGVLVDRFSRRAIVGIGKLVTALALAVPPGAAALGAPLTTEVLYATAVLHALSITCLAAAMDGLLQQICVREKVARNVALVSAVRQSGLVVGTGCAGFVLYGLGPDLSFTAGALLALLGAAVAVALPAGHPARAATRLEPYFRSLRLGLAFLTGRQALMLLALAIAFAFSIAQLTNALLPAYIEREIGATSRLYGLVEGAWAAGGIAISLLLVPLLARLRLTRMEFVALVFLGVCTLLFVATDAPLLLVLLHGLMGAGFSATRVLCDSRLLVLCPPDVIGRVRTNISAMTSLVGVGVYLAPTFIDARYVTPWYLAAGGTVCVAGLLMLGLRAGSEAMEQPSTGLQR